MELIKVHDQYFIPYISEEKILEKIKEIAKQINNDYKDKKPLFIAILNGSFMFAAELFKHLSIDAEICFIKLASYKGSKSTGNIVTAIGLDASVKSRDIIILEDILDTGKTLSEFIPQLENQQTASLKIAVLLHKKNATIFPVKADYLGFSIPDKFVVGFGLDYDGFGRNLKEIYQLKEN